MNDTYVPTIGLEIHAELYTKSKMFCGCKNDPDQEEANVHICPICTAHPGTLPVINIEAVKQVVRVGTAIGGKIADFTEFDRKNYFYPDIPKNYQISQYKYPLISGGSINEVAITRIHLEEDTARSTHKNDESFVDFNRAGVPLMELVTEPVIHDAETAVFFAKELRLLLQYLGAGKANLEKGEMRIEANISIAKKGESLGTKVEVKNLNSFKAVEQAIQYEIKRHKEVLGRGENVIQETRGWDEEKQKTFSQRMKEESHDYRYYPDPDLPKLYLSEISGMEKESIRKELPMLPWEVREKLKKEGMKEQTAMLLAGNMQLATFYSKVKKHLSTNEEYVLAGNYLTSDLLGLQSKNGYHGKGIDGMDEAEFAQLIQLVATNKISSRGAKDVLATWVYEGGNPEKIAEKLNIIQISDTGELDSVIAIVISENKSVADEYKNGKEAALQYLVGQGMKATKGAANPKILQEMIKKALQ